jgi:hypothetical protein
MKAITTKYIGPTNYKGARIKATAEGGLQVTVPYDYAGSTESRHHEAAVALCNKMKWSGCERLIGGGTEKGYVWVFLPHNCRCDGAPALYGAPSRSRKR